MTSAKADGGGTGGRTFDMALHKLVDDDVRIAGASVLLAAVRDDGLPMLLDGLRQRSSPAVEWMGTGLVGDERAPREPFVCGVGVLLLLAAVLFDSPLQAGGATAAAAPLRLPNNGLLIALAVEVLAVAAGGVMLIASRALPFDVRPRWAHVAAAAAA